MSSPKKALATTLMNVGFARNRNKQRAEQDDARVSNWIDHSGVPVTKRINGDLLDCGGDNHRRQRRDFRRSGGHIDRR